MKLIDEFIGMFGSKVIKHEGDKWVLYARDGTRKLGTFDTEEEAKKREGQIAFFRGKEEPMKAQKPGWEETENQYRYRLRDPGDFREGTMRTMAVPGTTGIQMIVGRLKPNLVPEGGDANSAVAQSLHFSAENWTMERAKKWVTDHPDVKAMDRAEGAVKVLKQKDGRYRWVGWPTNHFRDNDNPPEILSARGHKEFIAWAYKENKFPELWLWHTPGSKVGQADFLDFDSGLMVASGLFDEDHNETAKSLQKTRDALAMSHGFLRLKHDPQAVVTDRYRMAEMSITPRGVEANVFTNFMTVKEETMPLSKEKKEFLAKFLSEEQIRGIEDGTEDLRKAAEAAGVDFKELEAVDDSIPDPKPIKEEPVAATTIDVNIIVDRVVEAIADRFQFKALSDSLQGLSDQTKFIPDLSKRLGDLEVVVAEVKKAEDVKVAEAMRPKAAEGLFWMMNRPSQSPATALKEGDKDDDKLKAQKPTAAESLVEMMFQH